MNHNVKTSTDVPYPGGNRRRIYREKLLTFFRKFAVCFLSTGGLSIALVAYSILGGFVFMYIESPNEVRTRNEVRATMKRHARQLWDLTELMNILHPDNWTEVAEDILDGFSKEVFRATKMNGWDGSNEDGELQWSYAGSLLYSITVITTIGYGHIAPKTDAGKVVTIIYAVFGIPLTMLTLTNIGSFMAILFRFIYKNLVCGILCGRCRRCRKRNNNDVSTAIQNDVNDCVIAVETRRIVVPPEECYDYACAVEAGSGDCDCVAEHGCTKKGLEFYGLQEGSAFGEDGKCRKPGSRSTWNGSTELVSTRNKSTGRRNTGNGSAGNVCTGDGSTGMISTENVSTGNKSTGNKSTGRRSTENKSTGNMCAVNGCTENEIFEWLTSAEECKEKTFQHGGPEIMTPNHVDENPKNPDCPIYQEILQPSLERSQDQLKLQEHSTEMELDKNHLHENGAHLFTSEDKTLLDVAHLLTAGCETLPNGAHLLPTGSRAFPDGAHLLPNECRRFLDGAHLLPTGSRALPESSYIESDSDEPEDEVLIPSGSSRLMVEAKLIGDPERLTSSSVRSVTTGEREAAAAEGTRPLTVVKHRLMKWRRGFQIVLYADDNKRVKVPIYVSVIVMSVYVFAGSLLFTLWEKDWDYLVGSYFCFITLSTIGFGDYVPGTSMDDWAAQDKLVLCALYLVFGLALIAMCFDLMQEEVRSRCKAFARNIGLIKEDID